MDVHTLNKLFSELVEKKEAENLRRKKHNKAINIFVVMHLRKLIALCDENYIKKPEGFFVKKCPECKNKLLRRTYWDWAFRRGFGGPWSIKLIYFSCLKCDYEFVKISPLSFHPVKGDYP